MDSLLTVTYNSRRIHDYKEYYHFPTLITACEATHRLQQLLITPSMGFSLLDQHTMVRNDPLSPYPNSHMINFDITINDTGN